MLNATGGVVLLAALLHASWNALLHAHDDRFLAMTWMSVSMAAVATLAVVWLPSPERAAWPYILASGLVHNVYNLALLRAYRRGDLAYMYPIARGSSPLLVTAGAAMFASESLDAWQALGIVSITGGILALALRGRSVSLDGALAALATGATIALYSVIDGMGVRAAHGEAASYAGWMFLFYWLMPVLFVARRGRVAAHGALHATSSEVVRALAGGVVSVGAYGIVIWAMQRGEMGAVSALRETSVVFAVVIGRVVLREQVTAPQWLASSFVAAGAACLGL
jgi:drug/metabolite transporter (DMT)-like permease